MSNQRRADEVRELRGGRSPVEIATDLLEAMRTAREEAATPRPYPADETVLSCPGCSEWQLHYTDAVRGQWVLTASSYARGMAAFDHVVESILKDHVARECSQPLLFYTIAKNRGVL